MNPEVTSDIRDNYNRLAKDYADHLYHELDNKPLDRQLLEQFIARISCGGTVSDVGCGPGHIARYLRDAGARVLGLDLSSKMLDEARRRNPDICFREGDMAALDFKTGELAGITAFYAIVNLPRESLLPVFREFHRVLQTGGTLLLSFHIGDAILRPEELWGQPVTMCWYFFPTQDIVSLLEIAGFGIEQVIERDPYGVAVEHQSRRAYIFAVKSDC